jgi:hypothetical protein
MKITKGKRYTEEELEHIKQYALAAGEEFVAWMLPFYSPKMAKAVKTGWRASVGVSHIWLEGNAGLRVMLGGSTYEGERWLHLSASRKDRLPGWLELAKIKEMFLGEDREAYKVLPIKEHYVNDNPYVLHLWSNFDKPKYLPDFRLVDPRNGRLSI